MSDYVEHFSITFNKHAIAVYVHLMMTRETLAVPSRGVNCRPLPAAKKAYQQAYHSVETPLSF